MGPTFPTDSKRYGCAYEAIFLIIIQLSVGIQVPGVVKATLNEPLNENTSWIYHLTNQSVARGTGSYDGTYECLEFSEVRAIIRKANASTLVIEEDRQSSVSIRGEGFFKQSRDDHVNVTIISAIDRRAYTYSSYKILNRERNETREEPSKVGMPAVNFVSPSLSEVSDVPYYWAGVELHCTVIRKNVDFHGVTIPAITLHYSGPKKLSTHLGVFLFTEYGVAEGTFNFERDTGLKISSSARETAKSSGGSCCYITTTHNENYTLQSTSQEAIPNIMPTKAPSTSPPVQVTPSETPVLSKPPQEGSPLFAATKPGNTSLITVLVPIGIAVFVMAVVLAQFQKKHLKK